MASPTERRRSSDDVEIAQLSPARQEGKGKPANVIELDGSGDGSEVDELPEQQSRRADNEKIEVLGDPRAAAEEHKNPASRATQPAQTQDEAPSDLEGEGAGSATDEAPSASGPRALATAGASLPADRQTIDRFFEGARQAQQQRAQSMFAAPAAQPTDLSQRKRKLTSSEVPDNKKARPSNDDGPAGSSLTVDVQHAPNQGHPPTQSPLQTRVPDLAAPGGFAYRPQVAQAQDQHQQPTFLNPHPQQQQQQQQAGLPILYAIRLRFFELGHARMTERQYQHLYRSYESAVDAITSQALNTPQLRERATRVSLTMLDGTVRDALVHGPGLGLNGPFEVVQAEIYQVVVVPEDREWARRQA